MAFKVPEKYRVRSGEYGSTEADGNNGAFIFPSVPGRFRLAVIASDGDGWEHVSVSTPVRTPTWAEMCFIKSMFWGEDDCVVQFHPPKSEYVNQHPFCLHLWRKTDAEFDRPSWLLVGTKVEAA